MYNWDTEVYTYEITKQARKLQATLVRNYQPPTDRVTDGGEV